MMTKQKRSLFDELKEGFDALSEERAKRATVPHDEQQKNKSKLRFLVVSRPTGSTESKPSDGFHDYTYHAVWSPEDGQHIRLCNEFPSLS